jgi:hypothetical protein
MFHFFIRPTHCFPGSVSSGTSKKQPQNRNQVARPLHFVRASVAGFCFFAFDFSVDVKPLAKRRKRMGSSGKRSERCLSEASFVHFPLESILLREAEGR